MKALSGMVRWRCIRCAVSGVGLNLDDATVRVIRHNQKVHTEDHEETK
jgi:hypothetical protein